MSKQYMFLSAEYQKLTTSLIEIQRLLEVYRDGFFKAVRSEEEYRKLRDDFIKADLAKRMAEYKASVTWKSATVPVITIPDPEKHQVLIGVNFKKVGDVFLSCDIPNVTVNTYPNLTILTLHNYDTSDNPMLFNIVTLLLQKLLPRSLDILYIIPNNDNLYREMCYLKLQRQSGLSRLDFLDAIDFADNIENLTEWAQNVFENLTKKGKDNEQIQT